MTQHSKPSDLELDNEEAFFLEGMLAESGAEPSFTFGAHIPVLQPHQDHQPQQQSQSQNSVEDDYEDAIVEDACKYEWDETAQREPPPPEDTPKRTDRTATASSSFKASAQAATSGAQQGGAYLPRAAVSAQSAGASTLPMQHHAYANNTMLQRQPTHAACNTAQLLQNITDAEDEVKSAASQYNSSALTPAAVRLCKQYNNVGMRLLEAGSCNTAHELLTKAFAMVEPGGVLADTRKPSATGAPPDEACSMRLRALTLNNLGCFFRRRGRLEAALHYLKQVCTKH